MHADELGDALLGAVDEVAERAAEADGGVEAPVLEPAELGDVGDHTVEHAVLQARLGDLLAVQRELPRREVRHDDVRAEPRQLDREAARAGTDVEHAVARANEAAEVLGVNGDALRRRDAVVESRPLALAELVEVGGRVRRLVVGLHRASTSARSLSPRPERQTTTSSASSSSTRASACAGSSAGMMPSVRASRRNASSASSSVAPT